MVTTEEVDSLVEFMRDSESTPLQDEDACVGHMQACGELYVSSFGGCHAGLDKMERPQVVVCGLQDEQQGYISLMKKDEEIIPAFLNYLLNDCPWSSCYYDDDEADVINRRFLAIDTDEPQPLVVLACISLRYMGEHSRIAASWYGLAQAGVNKDLALLLAGFCCSAGSSVHYVTLDTQSHSAITPQEFTKDGFRNFINHRRIPCPSFKESCSLNGARLWYNFGAYKGDYLEDTHLPAMREVLLELAEGLVNNNPFDNKFIGAIPYREFFPAMAEYSNVILEDLK